MADMGVSCGSDYTEEMFCEYCHEKENKYVTAEGFCVNCFKYLCRTCLGYHCSLLPEHILQDKSSMPVDFYMEKCCKHPQELLKFYCITCKDIACFTCKTTFHTACKKVYHLPRLAAEFDIVKECSTLEDNLDLLEKEAEDLKGSIDNHWESIKTQNTNVIKVVKGQRQEVENIFNYFEKRIDYHHTANNQTLNFKNNKNNLLKADIQSLKTEVRGLKNSHQKCKVYLKTKEVADKKESIAENLRDLRKRLHEDFNRYSYTKAKENIGPEYLGKFTLKPLEVVKLHKILCFMVLLILACAIIFPCFSATTDVKSNFTDDVDCKSVKENRVLASPIITKRSKTIKKLSFQPIKLEEKSEKRLESLPKNINVQDLFYFSEHILFSITYNSKRYKDNVKDSSSKEHFTNRNVQVHYLTENKIIHSFHQQGMNQIMKVVDKVVAVTFKNRVELWYIIEHQFHFEWIEIKTLNIGQNCRNIHYRVGNMFLKCLDLDSEQYTIKQLNIRGNEVSSFMFNRSYYYAVEMTVSLDGKTIYISDSKENSVKSYTLEGHLIAEYRNGSLINPRKITVDSKGNLFVTGGSRSRLSNNIFFVSPDLTHGYELKQIDNVFPDSITYNEIDNSLYISSINDRSIKVFRIET